MMALKESMLLDSKSDILTKYKCPKCTSVLKDAVQPSCGHWLCQGCAEEVFNKAGEQSWPPTCPREDCKEQLTSEDGIDFFPDRFVRREIHNIPVKCFYHDRGCTWKGKFGEVLEHMKECQFASEPCDFCGKMIHNLEIESHKVFCTQTMKQCPCAAGLGCKVTHKMTQQDLVTHLSSPESIADHIQYLAAVARELHLQVRTSYKQLPQRQEGDGGRDEGYDSILPGRKADFDDEKDGIHVNKSHTSPVKCLQVDSGVSMTSRDGVGAGTVPAKSSTYRHNMQDSTVEELARTLNEQCVLIRDEVKETMKKSAEEIAVLRTTITKLEKQIRAKSTEIEDRDFRLSLIENSSYDGNMVWKIPQFSQRMTDAENGKYTSIFSLPFYTSRYGFKMCLRLYILGDGIGKNTHMSLFFVIMKGEFDNILQWPFTHKVTFKLLNQTGGRDILDTFQPDPMSSSFKKPKSDMNIASGCPRLVSHQDLKNGGFVLDDTIFIRCTVDQSTIRHP